MRGHQRVDHADQPVRRTDGPAARASFAGVPNIEERLKLSALYNPLTVIANEWETLADGVDPRKAQVGDYMTPDPSVVGPDTDAQKAARMMIDGGIRHLPVVDDDENYWGSRRSGTSSSS